MVCATERVQVDACAFTISTLLEVLLGFSQVPSTDRRVYQSGLRTPRDPLLRVNVTYTSAVHARPRPTGKIIFRVIFRAQTKLEWMKNMRK